MRRLLLQLSVAACALFPSNSSAETWEIKGFEPPADLAKAESAFLKVRKAKRNLADIPQNAIDTIGSIEDEIFQIQKRISDAIAEYATREKGMEIDIERDSVLRELAIEEDRAERERLNAEYTRLSAVYERALNDQGNLSAQDISKLRAEIEPRLSEIEELREKNHQGLVNVLRALDDRKTARENELLELAAKIPDQSDLMRPEDRLRRVKSIKIDAELKLEKLREQEHETATAFLRELYATAPEHLVSVTASRNKNIFYQAEWKPTGEATATTQAEKDAIASIIAEEEAKLRTLEKSTKTWRRVVREHGVLIKQESDAATDALNLIADEQFRTIVINAGLEATGAVVGAIVTGGISSVAQLASETVDFAKSLSKPAQSILGNIADEGDKYAIEQLSALIGKVINADAVSALAEANKVYDFDFGIGDGKRNFNVNRESGFRSDAAQLVAGDTTELVLTTTLEQGTKALARYMGRVTESTKAATAAELTKGAGVDIATTGLKAVVAARAQALNDARAKQYITAHINAETLHTSFLQAKHTWLRLDAVTKAHKEMVEALKLRMENGPRALELQTAKNELTEQAKGDRFDVVFEFSHPVSSDPVISAEGLNFLTLEPVTSERRKWKSIVEVEQDDLNYVQLDVGYKGSERPWHKLDSNPATPPKLASLLKDYWDGYEPGNDTNHTLSLGEKKPEFKCAAPQETASAENAGENTTVVAGIVETELLDCSYWAFAPWGVLGVQVADDRMEAEWVKTFSYETMIAEIFDEALSDDGIKRMGFKPGKFFSASNQSTQTSSDFEFDPIELWDQSAAGIYNGQISATMTYACNIPNTAGMKYDEVSTAFSSPISVLFAPIHSKISSKPAGISIAFDAMEYFKYEIVQEYTNNSGLVQIDGVKECGIESHPSSLGRSILMKGYPIDSDVDPLSFTAKSMLEYVENKMESEHPDFGEMELSEIAEYQTDLVNWLKREHLYVNGLNEAVSPHAIGELISHPKSRLSSIARIEDYLKLIQQ